MGDVAESVGKAFSTDFGSFLATALAVAGAILVTVGTGGVALVGYALIAGSTVIGLAVGYYQRKQLERALQQVENNGFLANTRSPEAIVPVVYGRARVGGNIIFMKTEGSKNEYLYMVMTLSEGPIEIGNYEFFFNEEQIIRYSYTQKRADEWRLRVNEGNINRIRVRVKYEEYDSDADEYDTITKTLELPRDDTTYSSTPVSGTFYQDGSVVITVPGGTYLTRWIEEVTIYEYSVDGGQNWLKKGNYQNNFHYFIDRGDGTGVGDVSVRDYFLNSLSFKKPKGVALLYAKLTYNENLYRAIPNITVLLDGRRLYDPRDGQTKFSDNPALVLWDYLTNTQYGFGIDSSRLDTGTFSSAATYCDSKKFTYNGVITDGRGYAIIEHILRHFRGFIQYSQGRFKLRYRDLNSESVVASIDESEIIEGTFSISLPDISEIPNAIRVSFINPQLNWKVDTMVIEDTSVSATEDRREISIELFGTNPGTAQRLGAYYLERARLSHVFSFTASPKFFNLEMGDLISITYNDYGIVNQTARIERITPTEDGYVRIEALIEDTKLYDDVVNLDIYEIDLTTLPQVNEPMYITSVTLSEVLMKDKDGRLKDWLKISWDASLPLVDTYEIWLRNEDETSYTHYGSFTASPVYIPDLVSPKTWYVKVVPVTIAGVKDVAGSPEFSLQLRGKLLPPPDVPQARASFLYDRIQLEWEPVEDLDLDGYEIRLGDNWETGRVIATRHKSTVLLISISKPGTYKFWIKAIDSVGNYSVNPADAEITITALVGRNIYNTYDVDFRNGTLYVNSQGEYDESLARDTLTFMHSRTWDDMITTEGFSTWDDWMGRYSYWFEPAPSSGSFESEVFDIGDVLEGRLYADVSYVAVGGGFTWKDLGAGPQGLQRTWDEMMTTEGFVTWNDWMAKYSYWHEPSDTWLEIGQPSYTWRSFVVIGTFDMELFYSEDGTTWNSFASASADVRARYLKLRLNALLNSTNQTFRFTDAFLYFDMPDRTESGQYSITSGTETIPFTQKFVSVKSIVLTSGTDGKYPVLVSYDTSSMQVKMSDNGAGEVHYTIFGY